MDPKSQALQTAAVSVLQNQRNMALDAVAETGARLIVAQQELTAMTAERDALKAQLEAGKVPVASTDAPA